MNIVHVSREFRGLGEAGGVKDVVHDLASTLVQMGHRVKVFTPLYGFLKIPLEKEIVLIWERFIEGWKARVYKMERGGIELLLVDTPWLGVFEGVYAYTRGESERGEGKEGQGYETEQQRNLSFQRVVVDSFQDLAADAEVLHAHDAHTALIGGSVSASVKILTLHNAGYPYQQNIVNKNDLLQFFPQLDSRWTDFLVQDHWSPILYAFSHSRVYTVSPYYAKEIMNEVGEGETGPLALELHKRNLQLKGYFNGYNFSRIHPGNEGELASIWYRWTQKIIDLSEYKSRAKRLFGQSLALRDFVGKIPDPDKIWLVFHARLTRQKGVEDVLQLLGFDFRDVTYVVMGQGEKRYREALSEIARTKPDVCYLPFYDDRLLLILLASTDFFLIPSVFEPCALTDLMALYYGAIPIVRKTGGLQKIRHLVEGFVYAPPQTLTEAVSEAIELKKNDPRKVGLIATQGFHRTRDFEIGEVVKQVWIPVYSGLEPQSQIW